MKTEALGTVVFGATVPPVPPGRGGGAVRRSNKRMVIWQERPVRQFLNQVVFDMIIGLHHNHPAS